MRRDPESGLVEAVLRACDLLRAFRYDGELLRLRDFVQRTGLSKTTTHRLLRTLEKGGLMQRAGADQYRSMIRTSERQKVRIGFAAQTTTSTFSLEVSESVERAAAAHGVELIEFNNRYSAKTALKNAELLIRERVNAVIEFQTYENVAPVIAARFVEAGIPVIAVEIPHPGAVYFGANNYQAGLLAGRALGKWAKERWNGVVDEVLLLEERIAGPLPQSRLTGALAGMREILPSIDRAAITRFDAKGAFAPALEIVRKHLRERPRQRTLVAVVNDPCALGALKAFEDAGRLDLCAVAGQNAIPEACEELRKHDTRLVGTVAYFPEKYGEDLIPLAISLASGKPTPPAVFIKHVLVTSKNVDQIYPPAKAARPATAAR
jgi:ribose transport system substrate-binding protein